MELRRSFHYRKVGILQQKQFVKVALYLLRILQGALTNMVEDHQQLQLDRIGMEYIPSGEDR